MKPIQKSKHIVELRKDYHMPKKILGHAYQYHFLCFKRWQNEISELVEEGIGLDDEKMLGISRKCDYHMGWIQKIAGQINSLDTGA